jgi:sporulation protein YlmC with PRC-barrel domain
MTGVSASAAIVRRRLAITGILAAGFGILWPPRLRAAELVIVDLKPLATAYRASKLVGASVTNDQSETIGKVDDILIEHPDRVLFAVVSVGGFLDIGEHLVVVPFPSLVIDEQHEKVVLPGATKAALKKLPEFHYA